MEKYLENIVTLTMAIIFFWWGGLAFIKYLKQPTVTDIENTFGDGPLGISFPAVTFCESIKEKQPKKCANNSSFFFETVQNCLKNDKDFDLDVNLAENGHNRSKYIKNAYIWYGRSANQNTKEYENEIWLDIYHKRYGACYTLDLTRAKDLEFLAIDVEIKPVLMIEFTENCPDTISLY